MAVTGLRYLPPPALQAAERRAARVRGAIAAEKAAIQQESAPVDLSGGMGMGAPAPTGGAPGVPGLPPPPVLGMASGAPPPLALGAGAGAGAGAPPLPAPGMGTPAPSSPAMPAPTGAPGAPQAPMLPPRMAAGGVVGQADTEPPEPQPLSGDELFLALALWGKEQGVLGAGGEVRRLAEGGLVAGPASPDAGAADESLPLPPAHFLDFLYGQDDADHPLATDLRDLHTRGVSPARLWASVRTMAKRPDLRSELPPSLVRGSKAKAKQEKQEKDRAT